MKPASIVKTLLLSLVVLWPGTLSAIGILTISNNAVNQQLSIGEAGIVLDANMIFTNDATASPGYYYNGLNNTFAVGDATWLGGTIYVTIDQAPANNTLDLLTCTSADPATITVTPYNVTTRTLAIAAVTGTTFPNLQATLRTLTYRIPGGQQGGLRHIRIWVETAGYKFSNSRGGRLYLAYNYGSSILWPTVRIPRIRRYGLTSYFASIMNATEDADTTSMVTLVDNALWFGGRTSNANSSTSDWAWIDGPDRGTVFWPANTGNVGSGGITNANSPVYANWHTGYPGTNAANLGYVERYRFSGSLSDWALGDSSTTRQCVLLEFGGVGTPITNGYSANAGTPTIDADGNVFHIMVIQPNPFIMSMPY